MRDECANELVGCRKNMSSLLVMYSTSCCLYFLHSLHLKWSKCSSRLEREREKESERERNKEPEVSKKQVLLLSQFLLLFSSFIFYYCGIYSWYPFYTHTSRKNFNIFSFFSLKDIYIHTYKNVLYLHHNEQQSKRVGEANLSTLISALLLVVTKTR